MERYQVKVFVKNNPLLIKVLESLGYRRFSTSIAEDLYLVVFDDIYYTSSSIPTNREFVDCRDNYEVFNSLVHERNNKKDEGFSNKCKNYLSSAISAIQRNI